VLANGRFLAARSVISNANVKTTLERLVGPEHVPADYLADCAAVRLNNSSCQVFLGVRAGESIPFLGDLFFTSTRPTFDSAALCEMDTASRTFSLYYPKGRPGRPGPPRYAIVSSTNAWWHDWANLSDAGYAAAKDRLVADTLDALERYLPGVRAKIDHVEAATPRTFAFYTQAPAGTSFGTKFEGLKVSMDLPERIGGLYHAGSVGIIMSGWLGAANYGAIVANKVDARLFARARSSQEAGS
jgi:phytoene dehydrogenase-like protein